MIFLDLVKSISSQVSIEAFTGPSGSDNVINSLNKSNIAPLVKIHACIYNLDLIRHTFATRLKFIELIRHPLDTIDSWVSAQNYYRNGVRGFSFRLDNGHIVLTIYEIQILQILALLRQYNFLFECIRNIYRDKSPDFTTSFECFLFDSKVCTNALSLFLARDPDLHQIRRF